MGESAIAWFGGPKGLSSRASGISEDSFLGSSTSAGCQFQGLGLGFRFRGLEFRVLGVKVVGRAPGTVQEQVALKECGWVALGDHKGNQIQQEHPRCNVRSTVTPQMPKETKNVNL